MDKFEQIVKGMTILKKYGDLGICAEHDSIYAGPDDYADVTKEDKEALDTIGWFEDEESNRWMLYV